jgi:HlyD family secretion protein
MTELRNGGYGEWKMENGPIRHALVLTRRFPFGPILHSPFSIVAVLVALGACSSDRQPDAYGHIEAIDVVVGAQSTGQLESFMPAEGVKLAAGVSVAVVDASTLDLQMQQLQAQRTASASRVDEVTKQIAVLETQRAIAQRSYERVRRLYEVQAATAVQLDQVERDFRTLGAQIEAAQAQRQTASRDVASADARVAQIRDQIRKSRITNPITGTVLATYAKTGEFVQTGQPLYKIASLDTLQLRAYVSEPQLAHLRIGQAVQVSVDVGAGDHRAFAGTVTWISAQAEFTPTPIETRDQRSNLVYAIKVLVPNRDGVLKIGMPADVQFATTASR